MSVSPAWDTDSEQGFIQAPTGLREGRREGKEDEAADIGSLDRRLNLGPHSGPKRLFILYRQGAGMRQG
jgi:hypothetical protein